MAFTTTDLAPMRPASYMGGTQALPIMQFLADGIIGTARIRKGDILRWSTNKLVRAFNTAVPDDIVGLAEETVTTDDTLIRVCLALPGVKFESNVVDIGLTGAEADTVSADIDAPDIIGRGMATDEAVVHGSTSIICLTRLGINGDFEVATPTSFAPQVSQFALHELPGTEGQADADLLSSSLINPRVYFLFTNSYWAMAAVATQTGT